MDFEPLKEMRKQCEENLCNNKSLECRSTRSLYSLNFFRITVTKCVKKHNDGNPEYVDCIDGCATSDCLYG